MPTVCTTDGDYVHVVCADREAKDTHSTRSARALADGVSACMLLFLNATLGMPNTFMTVLVMLLLVGHVLLNRRWWLLTMRVRRWRK